MAISATMSRADLVYKLVEDLEPVLEQYASSGVEIAVLISKVNDNVVGYQGTKLGKDFLEKNTHFTEQFRKFCKEFWYGQDNVMAFNPSPKKISLESSVDEDVSFLASSESGTVLNGIESFTILDGSRLPLSAMTGDIQIGQDGSKKLIFQTTTMTEKKIYQNKNDDMPKKKITRKAKYRCHICPSAFFRRTHRLNIHMHENHNKDLSEAQLEMFPLPEGYEKRKNLDIIQNAVDGILSGEKKPRKLLYRYRCEECDINFKRLENFNKHRDKRHDLSKVDENYGIKDGYQCEYCPKVFASRWNLQRHIDIHLGQRKFTCNICERSFFRTEELKKHLKIHSDDPVKKTGRGKISCYSCGMPMRVMAGKECQIPWAHEDKAAIESVYKCKTCKSIFYNEDEYNVHMLDHKGQGKEVMSEHDYISIPNLDDISLVEESDDILNDTSLEENETTKKSGDKDDTAETEEMSDKPKHKSEQMERSKRIRKENKKYDDEDTSFSKKNKNVSSAEEEGENVKKTPKVVKFTGGCLEQPRGKNQQIKYEGAFTCKICSKSFVTTFVLNRHLLTHTNPDKYECDICGHKTSRKDLMTRHIKRNHTSDADYHDVGNVKCPDAKGHEYHTEQKHSQGDVKVKCELCAASFSSPSALRKHTKKIHDEPVKCVIEKMELRSPEDKNVRKRKAPPCFGCDGDCSSGHTNTIKNIKKEPEEDSPVQKQPVKPRESARRKAANKESSKQKDDEKNQDSPVSKINKKNEGFEFSITEKSHINYTCNICQKNFRYQSEYRSHQMIHSDKKVFPCSMCSMVYLTPVKFKQHLDKHDNNGNFSCETCTFSTDSLEHLNKHRTTHNQQNHKSESKENKIPICDQCGKECNTISRLKTHMLTHTGDKPYECVKCDKKFHSHDILKNHEKIHLDEKLYLCEDCGASFHQNSTLITHRLTHKPPAIECKFCKKKFRMPSALRCHLASKHSDESDVRSELKCDVCLKPFPTTKDLDRHFRTHTGDKPFQCGICERKFSNSGNCKRHEESHNEDDDEKQSGKSFQNPLHSKQDIETFHNENEVEQVTKKFKCNHCEKSYVYKSDVKRHVKKCHPDVEWNDQEFQNVETTESDAEKQSHDPDTVEAVDMNTNENKTVGSDKKETFDAQEADARETEKQEADAMETEKQEADNMEPEIQEVVNTDGGKADKMELEKNVTDETGENNDSENQGEKVASDNSRGIIESGNKQHKPSNKQENQNSSKEMNSAITMSHKKQTKDLHTNNIFTILSTESVATETINNQDETSANSSTPSTAVRSLQPSRILNESISDVTIPENNLEDVIGLPMETVQNVLLQSEDNETGRSTIYVVQTENDGHQEEVIYVVTDNISNETE